MESRTRVLPMSHERILIAAGGTGGHVYPALAVAENLRKQDAVILWLGTETGLEARVVPANGHKLSTIRIRGLRGKGLWRLILAPFVLSIAIFQALLIIRRFKPSAVLGMGGYVSGPAGIAAWLLRVPLYIHEQNAVAGMTNRLLLPFAKLVMQGFPDTFSAGNKVMTTGNPVRSNIIEAAKLDTNDVSDGPKEICLLILGGSLGARALNQTLPSALKSLPADNHFHIWHQTGSQHLQQTQDIYRENGLNEARIEAYIEDMAAAYEWADLVLCRAGALTLAELCVCGLASVLVPYPFAVDDHQTVNARFLSDKDAAVLLPETALQSDKLAALLSDLWQNRPRLRAMAHKTRELACFDASTRVAAVCLGGVNV
jgi:UDP-N-acetylglucosamine--N-acetylmuramyl-(pentapeptide) pyrophosphoryl-undecaprenol N-acetylglucosamine transferase